MAVEEKTKLVPARAKIHKRGEAVVSFARDCSSTYHALDQLVCHLDCAAASCECRLGACVWFRLLRPQPIREKQGCFKRMLLKAGRCGIICCMLCVLVALVILLLKMFG